MSENNDGAQSATEAELTAVEVEELEKMRAAIDKLLPNPHDLAPASAAPSPAPVAVPVSGTGDQRDTSMVDTLGNAKGDQASGEEHDPLHGSGPRGANVSPEHLGEARKAESAESETKRLQQGMTSTDAVDSIGNKQGEFKVEAQGLDKHGARIPDVVTEELVEAPPAMVGPRGKNVPNDCWHGKRG